MHFAIALHPPGLRDEKRLQATSKTLISLPLAAVGVYALGSLGWVDPSIPEGHRWLAGILGVHSIPDALRWTTVPVLIALVLRRMVQERGWLQQRAHLSLSIGKRGLTVQGRRLSWDACTMVIQRSPKRQCSRLSRLSTGEHPSLQLDWLALQMEEHHRVAAVIREQQPTTPSAVPAELKQLRAQLRK